VARCNYFAGAGIIMEAPIGGAVTHWLDGEPVRNLADWLLVIAQRRRVSLRAASDILTAALAAEAGASLLVVTPGDEPYPVPSSWGRSRPAPAPTVAVTRSGGRQVRIPLPSRGIEQAEASTEQACGPLAALAALKLAWERKLHAGIDGLRTIWRGGAGLGVTDAAVRQLWPELFAGEPGKPQSPAVIEKKALPRPGTPVPGLPSDAALARELEDEKARQPHGAMKRLVDKYGCNRSTLQRRVNKGKAALQPSVFPRVAGWKR
jgi:hypothetical protein